MDYIDVMSQKVLVICGQEIIEERNDGGKKCSYRNYELFQQVYGKENVYLYIFTNGKYASVENVFRLPAYKNNIERSINIAKGSLFTSPKNENLVVDFIEKNAIDIVFFERSMFGSLIKKIKTRNLQCKLWVFVHNIEKNYFKKKLSKGRLYNIFPYLQILKSEKETFHYVDYIITLTSRDSELIERMYNRKSDMILPMTFKDVYDSRKIKESTSVNMKNLLFVGSLFPPNYDGIKWFVENVMPELRDYRLSIVGKNFELKKKELECSNVHVIGTVDDLEEFYYLDNIMIMPIFYGDGMKIKTAEAMMYGKIILASDEALEGYDVEGVSEIFRCNTKEEYIRVLKSKDFSEHNIMNNSVRKIFLEKYCFDSQVILCKNQWLKSEKI